VNAKEVFFSLLSIAILKDASIAGLITMMQIKEGKGEKTTVPDPYNIRGIPPKVANYMVSTDDELADARKNRSRTSSVNEFDDREVLVGERSLT
jgi:non-homologous end joining protein Ku